MSDTPLTLLEVKDAIKALKTEPDILYSALIESLVERKKPNSELTEAGSYADLMCDILRTSNKPIVAVNAAMMACVALAMASVKEEHEDASAETLIGAFTERVRNGMAQAKINNRKRNADKSNFTAALRAKLAELGIDVTVVNLNDLKDL
jgi:hypothetical protein